MPKSRKENKNENDIQNLVHEGRPEEQEDTQVEDSVIKDDELDSSSRMEPELSAELDNLGKVREILFGGSVDRLNAQLDAIESSFTERMEIQLKEYETKLDSLESFIKKQLDILSSAISDEKGERIDTLEEISNNLSNFRTDLGDEVTQLNLMFNSKSDRQNEEMRKKIDDESKELGERLSSYRSNTNDSIEKLKEEKASRASLAEMFENLAKVLVEENAAK